MKIAILGIRGIPANYGGFETLAEELSTRLVDRGHEVTVYGRSNNVRRPSRTYRGVQLVVLPTISTKHLDTVTHTLLSVFHALGRGYDVILMCNAANAIFSIVPRIARIPIALNVDGIDRLRKKWGTTAQVVYKISEYMATIIPSVVITDAKVIKEYYRSKHGTDSVMIAYGAECHRIETTEVLGRLGIKERSYLLYVSRLEPENNAHLVIEAYRRVETEMPLVVVGDASYAVRYIRGLKAMADERVIFAGAVYGTGYDELRSHAYAYVQATEVGGTHPALLEAMGAGNCVLAKDTPEHREVLGETGYYFSDVEGLILLIRKILADGNLVEESRVKTRLRADTLYSWDVITDQYEALFAEMSAPLSCVK